MNASANSDVRSQSENAVRVQTLLTVQEAARVLRIGRNTCYELIRRGQLPHIRLGRLIRVPRHALMLWLGEDASIASADRQADASPSLRH